MLAERLLRLVQQDLAIPRSALNGEFVFSAQLFPNQHKKHALCTKKFRIIIRRHGWPLAEHIGQDGALAAWMLAMHSYCDLEFMMDCLGALGMAVRSGQAPAWQQAFLEDRTCLLFGEPQRFGTHVCRDQQGRLLIAETVDPGGLAERRRSVNMPPCLPISPSNDTTPRPCAHCCTEGTGSITRWQQDLALAAKASRPGLSRSDR